MLLSVRPEASELVEVIPAVNELTYRVTCNLVRHARANTITCGNANVAKLDQIWQQLLYPLFVYLFRSILVVLLLLHSYESISAGQIRPKVHCETGRHLSAK